MTKHFKHGYITFKLTSSFSLMLYPDWSSLPLPMGSKILYDWSLSNPRMQSFFISFQSLLNTVPLIIWLLRSFSHTTPDSAPLYTWVFNRKSTLDIRNVWVESNTRSKLITPFTWGRVYLNRRAVWAGVARPMKWLTTVRRPGIDSWQ